jgi:ketosteroid isomerase-like protein
MQFKISRKRIGTIVQKLLLTVLLAGSLVGMIEAQELTGDKAEQIKKDVLKVEEERAQALEKGDLAVLNRILADDYEYVNVLGELNTKAQRLTYTQSGVSKHESLKEEDFRLRVYGDTVVMTGRASGVVNYRGKVNNKARRFTNVYIKQGGQWRLVAHHATTIAEQ